MLQKGAMLQKVAVGRWLEGRLEVLPSSVVADAPGES
jgi:hypothetical protein